MNILIMCKFIEFYNSKIKKMFVLKKVLRFSGFNLGVPAMPSGFPLYLCSPPPAPKSRPRTKIPVPAPRSRSQRMPLQSLTHGTAEKPDHPSILINKVYSVTAPTSRPRPHIPKNGLQKLSFFRRFFGFCDIFVVGAA